MDNQANHSTGTGGIFWGLVALLVWLPIPFGSNRPWAVAIMEIWVYLLAIWWLLAYYMRRCDLTLVFRKSKIVLLVMMLWLGFVSMQIVPLPPSFVASISPSSFEVHTLAQKSGWMSVSVDSYETIEAWFKSLSYVLLFCLCILLIENEKRLRLCAYAIVFSGVFQAFYGSFMTLSGLEYGFFIKKYAYVGHATGTFINRNHLAGYLELCIAVGTGLMISMLRDGEERSLRQRLKWLVETILGEKLRLRLYLAVMVIALVLTHSRMGNTAFFSGLFASAVLALLLSKGAPRSMIILLVSLVLIDIFIVGTWFGMEKVVQRIEMTSRSYDASRIDVNKNSMMLWKDYRYFGSGGGSYYAVFPGYKTSDVKNYYDHAHDDYLEFASEYGLFGISLCGLMVFLSFSAAIKALYKRRNPLMRGMAFASIMGIISMMIHSFVDFNLQIPANASTFMVVIALGWISLNLETVSQQRTAQL